MAVEKWTAAQIPSQNGKLILVTGANSGIGYQAAVELARHGAHVLLGCRNLTKGQDALRRLRTEVPTANADVVELDMASLASIRAFASAFLGNGTALDVLINNAGVMALPTREQTVDGFERQFGTNHLGHFALTGLLWPALTQASAPRVVTVASLAHRNGKIDFDDLQGERNYQPRAAYNNSKWANLLFAKELDRRVKAAGVPLLSVAVHPGISRTNIVENGPGSKGKDLTVFLLKFLGPFLMQDDTMGALPTEYAATMPGLSGGEYVGPDGFKEFKGHPTLVQPQQAIDENTAKRLWEVSEELTGVRYPGLG